VRKVDGLEGVYGYRLVRGSAGLGITERASRKSDGVSTSRSSTITRKQATHPDTGAFRQDASDAGLTRRSCSQAAPRLDGLDQALQSKGLKVIVAAS